MLHACGTVQACKLECVLQLYEQYEQYELYELYGQEA